MNDNGFDKSEEGQALVALLKRHAPPMPSSQAGTQAVISRIRTRGRLHVLRWAGPLTAAAAAVAVAFFIFAPIDEHQPNTVADKPRESTTPVEIRRDRAYPEIVAVVRGETIDAGLKDGLRVGDVLEGPGGATARVTAVGVFEARISAEVPFSRGVEVRARVSTDAQKRAAKFSEFGGDPGAFFEFGVLVSALSLNEARMQGIADGRALVVDEVIAATLKDGQVQSTLASRLDLRAGDIIIEANGATVRSVNDFAQALGWSLEPTRLNIRILRNGKQVDLKL
jgi:hypothetical protein